MYSSIRVTSREMPVPCAIGPYQIAPQGMNYRVQVTLTYGEPGSGHVNDYPPQRAEGRGRDWYRGDCHLHTVYSDGKRLPSEVAAGARAAGLDFMVSTVGIVCNDCLTVSLYRQISTHQ